MKTWSTLLILIFLSMNAKSEYKNKNYPELNKLKKLTVGPDDQLDSSIDTSNKLLVFTKKANMISQLQVKNLESGAIKDLLPQDADSSQGKLNYKNQLVLTYFKYNSNGDICWSKESIKFDKLPLSEAQIKCIGDITKNFQIERSQGFWHTNDEFIYLEKYNQKYQLVLYNILTSSRREIATSQSPIVSAFGVLNGELIVYSEVINQIPQFIILKLKTGEKNLIPSKLLPGISGLMNISEDEKTLYFSHYMADSNNDGTIDGHDNSVIWKMKFESLNDYLKISHSNDLKIEQLTPMDFNCSYPFSNQKQLFLTCAFQGSLDIYQLPEEGVVPNNWDSKTLSDSFSTSRTYQDRILILNTQKFRNNDIDELHRIDQSLLYLHVMAKDYLAAQFYLNKIKGSKNKDTANWFAFEILLQALELEQVQPSNVISLKFRDAVTALIKKLESIKSLDSFTKLVSFNLQAMIGKKPNLKVVNQQIGNNNKPFEYWLYFHLMQKMIPQTKEKISEWVIIYKKVLSSKSLRLESQIYYAYDFLDLLTLQDIALRKKIILDFKDTLTLNKELQALFENELNVISLVSATDEKAKVVLFQKIDKLLREFKSSDDGDKHASKTIFDIDSNSNYFLRKAMNVRCILNFLNYQEFKNLNVIAANWLRDTPKSSTEFSYARQVVIRAALEQAYGYWQKKNARFAADYFFQSLSLTDDLESHSGYFNSMKEINQSKNMIERLNYLENHGAIPDGAQWLNILLLLDESNQSHYFKNLDLALTTISEMRVDLNDPLKYLITGYIYLEKIKLSQIGVEMNAELLKHAHQNLILASDLARENPRVQAAALTNLGLLHLWSQNYGQSVKFWELRKNLGFDDTDKNTEKNSEKYSEYQSFLWFYSQSLYLNNQNKAAVEAIQLIPKNQLTPEIIERTAFYSSLTENWSKALEYYQKLETTASSKLGSIPSSESEPKFKPGLEIGPDFEKINEPSRTKIRLNKAYVLFKLGKFTESQNLFKKIVEQKLQKIPIDSRFRKMEFDPKSLNNIAQGFLSQMGSKEERIHALKRRIDLLEEDLPNLIQAQIKLAELLFNSDLNSSINLMQSALQNCQKFANENGSIGQTVFKTLTNYLVHGLLNHSHYSTLNSKGLREQMQKTLNSLNKQMESASIVALKNQWHLQYLWGLYRQRVLSDKDLQNWKHDLMESVLTKKILQDDPEGLKQLQNKLLLFEIEET